MDDDINCNKDVIKLRKDIIHNLDLKKVDSKIICIKLSCDLSVKLWEILWKRYELIYLDRSINYKDIVSIIRKLNYIVYNKKINILPKNLVNISLYIGSNLSKDESYNYYGYKMSERSFMNTLKEFNIEDRISKGSVKLDKNQSRFPSLHTRDLIYNIVPHAPDWLNTSEIASNFKVTLRTIYKYLRTGEKKGLYISKFKYSSDRIENLLKYWWQKAEI